MIYKKDLFIAFCAAFLILTLGLMADFFLSKASCYKKTYDFDDSKWGVFEGCMVKHEGMWLPLDNIVVAIRQY